MRAILALITAGVLLASEASLTTTTSLSHVSSWSVQDLPSSYGDLPDNLQPSLALDSHDRPRIAYYVSPDFLYGSLHYLVWNGASWGDEVIDPKGGAYPSLQLEADDSARIAYYEFGPSGKIRLATQTNSGWITETIRSDLPVMGTGFDIALGLTSGGAARVLYPVYSGGEYQFWLLSETGASWQDGQLPTSVGFTPAIAVGSDDTVHASFFEPDNHQIIYIHQNSLGDWSRAVVGAANDPGYQVVANALELDLEGEPHVVYADASQPHIVYATLTESGWVTETVASAFSTAAALTFDELDVPHIAYIDDLTGQVIYAVKSAQGWSSQSVAGDGANSVDIDVSTGHVPYISYTQATTGLMQLAFLLPHKVYVPTIIR